MLANVRLVTLAGRHLTLARGERLFQRGDAIRELYLLSGGELCLQRDTLDGASLTLHRAHAGDVVAEGSVWAERYHCDAQITCEAMLHAIPMRQVRDALRKDAALANTWAALLARELQQSRARTEILRLRGVAARLDAWCLLTGADLPARGEQRGVADEIGVMPEALYRELARRRDIR